MQLAQGTPPITGQLSAKTLPAPPQMARFCRDGHQATAEVGVPLLAALLSLIRHYCQHKQRVQRYTEILPLVTLLLCEKRDKRA